MYSSQFPLIPTASHSLTTRDTTPTVSKSTPLKRVPWLPGKQIAAAGSSDSPSDQTLSVR